MINIFSQAPRCSRDTHLCTGQVTQRDAPLFTHPSAPRDALLFTSSATPRDTHLFTSPATPCDAHILTSPAAHRDALLLAGPATNPRHTSPLMSRGTPATHISTRRTATRRGTRNRMSVWSSFGLTLQFPLLNSKMTATPTQQSCKGGGAKIDDYNLLWGVLSAATGSGRGLFEWLTLLLGHMHC